MTTLHAPDPNNIDTPEMTALANGLVLPIINYHMGRLKGLCTAYGSIDRADPNHLALQQKILDEADRHAQEATHSVSLLEADFSIQIGDQLLTPELLQQRIDSCAASIAAKKSTLPPSEHASTSSSSAASHRSRDNLPGRGLTLSFDTTKAKLK